MLIRFTSSKNHTSSTHPHDNIGSFYKNFNFLSVPEYFYHNTTHPERAFLCTITKRVRSPAVHYWSQLLSPQEHNIILTQSTDSSARPFTCKTQRTPSLSTTNVSMLHHVFLSISRSHFQTLVRTSDSHKAANLILSQLTFHIASLASRRTSPTLSQLRAKKYRIQDVLYTLEKLHEYR